ncbi:MAG: hypothetical protein JNK56_08235 [Myxococcales bacterium]|nr:hypothetical protein [Myxococcales bacterium]
MIPSKSPTTIPVAATITTIIPQPITFGSSAVTAAPPGRPNVRRFVRDHKPRAAATATITTVILRAVQSERLCGEP